MTCSPAASQRAAAAIAASNSSLSGGAQEIPGRRNTRDACALHGTTRGPRRVWVDLSALWSDYTEGPRVVGDGLDLGGDVPGLLQSGSDQRRVTGSASLRTRSTMQTVVRNDIWRNDSWYRPACCDLASKQQRDLLSRASVAR